MQPASAAVFVEDRAIFFAAQKFADGDGRKKVKRKSAHCSDESLRRDAYNRDAMLIEFDGFADDVAIAAKLFLPEIMAQNHHWISARFFGFFLREKPAHLRADAKRFEITGHNDLAPNPESA